MIFVQGVFSSWPPSVQNKNENGQKDHYWMITHRRDNFAGEVFCKALLLIPIQLLSDCCTSRQSFDTCTMYSYPKGLRAESTGAVTGRRCPHSGEGEDFLTGQLNFFTKTAVTPERKVEKSIPRWEMNGHSEGYKRAVDQNWGRMAKIGFLDQKPRFWVKKKALTSVP